MCTSLEMTFTPPSELTSVKHGRTPVRLFGRNMDIEAHFGEGVTVMPRDFALCFRALPPLSHHFAIIGMACVMDGYPLFADAMNEKGLCMAGLHFPHNAVYATPCGFDDDRRHIAPFELIPYLLGTCATATEVRAELSHLTVSDIQFSQALPNTPLHWHISAPDGGLVLEVTAEGMRIYDDQVGVLTNNPPYPYHTAAFHRYDGMTAESLPVSARVPDTPLGETYDLGLGAVGLPGDYTSPARFVRCAVLRRLSDKNGAGEEIVARFFRVLGAVAPPEGCVKNNQGENHSTLYTACMDTSTLTYHVLTNQKITPLSVVLTDAGCEGEVLWAPHS